VRRSLMLRYYNLWPLENPDFVKEIREAVLYTRTSWSRRLALGNMDQEIFQFNCQHN
jgi:hypothetical protein